MNKQDVLDAIEINDSHPTARYYSVGIREPGQSKVKSKWYYHTVEKSVGSLYNHTPDFNQLVDLVLLDWKDKPFEVTKKVSIGIYEKSDVMGKLECYLTKGEL